MNPDYQKILDYILISGKRLAERTGNIADIGITKKYLTEEDLVIERGLREIAQSFGADHVLYAEEENEVFHNSKNLWVVDPISGTQGFIEGRPNGYSIVVSHLVDHKTVFAAVYNPTADELFTAYQGKGAFLNNKPIKVSSGQHRVILRPSTSWDRPEVFEKLTNLLKDHEIESNWNSIALQYCQVACGRADGIITATKDAFPEFAGGFIIQAAGGRFTNISGSDRIQHTDRVFVGGNMEIYNSLFEITKEVLGN